MNDLITCSRCGVTFRGHQCPYKVQRKREKDRQSDRFRNTAVWQKKREEIKIRDKYLCQVCLRNLYHTINFLNSKSVEVHHITTINEDYNRRLDNSNLICLCSFHHKMAENGGIKKENCTTL